MGASQRRGWGELSAKISQQDRENSPPVEAPRSERAVARGARGHSRTRQSGLSPQDHGQRQADPQRMRAAVSAQAAAAGSRLTPWGWPQFGELPPGAVPAGGPQSFPAGLA